MGIMIVIGNGMQTIILHIFSLQRSMFNLASNKISASIIYKHVGSIYGNLLLSYTVYGVYLINGSYKNRSMLVYKS